MIRQRVASITRYLRDIRSNPVNKGVNPSLDPTFLLTLALDPDICAYGSFGGFENRIQEASTFELEYRIYGNRWFGPMSFCSFACHVNQL